MSIVGLGSLVLTVAALFLYFNAYEAPQEQGPRDEPVEQRATPVPKSIAVLRFLNIGGNPSIAYLCDGLTEELIHELTNLKTLKVAARTSVWPLATSDLSVKEIIGRLGVEKVLEGSIRSEGEEIRVTAQLIDEDGFHLWSQSYDRELADILQIQKDIAAQVVEELDLVLSDDFQARLKSRPTHNSAAYNQYLRGRQSLREPRNFENIATAEKHFVAAIEADNRFPLAYAGLCETYLANYRLTSDTDTFSDAEIACHRALTLDGGLAEVYTALGNLYRHSGQYDKAEQEYATAMKINPMLEEANFGLGRVLESQGRLDEAESTLRRSVEMEPGYWGVYQGFGNFLHRQGRHAESATYYEEVTRLAPDYAGGFINLGAALHWLGDWDGAEEAWRRALELEPDSLSYENMGTLFYYRHEFEKAAEMQQKAIDIAPSDHRPWGKLAAALRYIEGKEGTAQANYAKAIELVEARLAVNPDQPEDLAYLAVYRTNTGDNAASREVINRSLQLAPDSPTAHYFSAILEMNSGNIEKALSELEKAAGLGYSLRLLAEDPEFARLRQYPDFRAMLDKQNN
jgi:TolB-like protein/Tfp pilus assembly protein PilF